MNGRKEKVTGEIPAVLGYRVRISTAGLGGWVMRKPRIKIITISSLGIAGLVDGSNVSSATSAASGKDSNPPNKGARLACIKDV